MDKRQQFLETMGRGKTLLHLDATRAGVVVPPHLKTHSQLCLSFSYRYAIPDLQVTDDAVLGSLTFSGQRFCCTVPWAAVYAITSGITGESVVWPADLPLGSEQSIGQLSIDQPAHPGGPPSGAPQADAANRAGGRRSHLRLVK